MPIVSGFSDYQPLTWIKRVPVYVTTVLVAAYTLGMFATAILQAVGVSLMPFAFTAELFARGMIWQPLTYSLIQQPSFFFAISMLFLYTAGSEVEKFLGRKRFLMLLAMFILLPPAILLIWQLFGIAPPYVGAYELTAAMFVAFATIYPNVEFFGFVTLKWLVFAGLTLASMSYLPAHDWPRLAILWSLAAAAFGYIRVLQRGIILDWRGLIRRRPKLRVLPRERTVARSERGRPVESIDPILDKIARHGLGSLTTAEREKLERARLALLKKQ